MDKSLHEKAAAIIQKRQLCSLMNNTKWSELVSAVIREMPFPPAFAVKYLTSGDEPDAPGCAYYGDWTGENFPPAEAYVNIEWIKVQPRYQKHRGMLVSPETIDASVEFEAILKRYHIPYEEENGVYCIYGYK